MAYDPLNRRIIVAGGGVRLPDGWRDADDVLAFDVAARRWIELVAPSVPYPATPTSSP